jgi:hypothetical protein
MSAKDQRAVYKLSHFGDCLPDAVTILRAGRRRWRTKRPFLPEREIEAKHAVSCGFECAGHCNQKRSLCVAAGAVRQDKRRRHSDVL